jgi:hypothetical protein
MLYTPHWIIIKKELTKYCDIGLTNARVLIPKQNFIQLVTYTTYQKTQLKFARLFFQAQIAGNIGNFMTIAV